MRGIYNDIIGYIKVHMKHEPQRQGTLYNLKLSFRSLRLSQLLICGQLLKKTVPFLPAIAHTSETSTATKFEMARPMRFFDTATLDRWRASQLRLQIQPQTGSRVA